MDSLDRLLQQVAERDGSTGGQPELRRGSGHGLRRSPRRVRLAVIEHRLQVGSILELEAYRIDRCAEPDEVQFIPVFLEAQVHRSVPVHEYGE
jgi:hypothetical protein